MSEINEACRRIDGYVTGMSYEQFVRDCRTVDAVIRNLEIIGEAVKQLPEDFRSPHSQIPWRRIAGLRDILAHTYFGIDEQIIWDVVVTKVPDLATLTRALLAP